MQCPVMLETAYIYGLSSESTAPCARDPALCISCPSVDLFMKVRVSRPCLVALEPQFPDQELDLGHRSEALSPDCWAARRVPTPHTSAPSGPSSGLAVPASLGQPARLFCWQVRGLFSLMGADPTTTPVFKSRQASLLLRVESQSVQVLAAALHSGSAFLLPPRPGR